MAEITWTSVTDFDSGLSSVTSAARTAILAYVNAAHDESELGDEGSPELNLARIYLAAHLGRVNLQSPNAAGAVASESAGRLSRSYVQSATSTDELRTTKWGTLYLALMNRASNARVGFVV